MKKILFLLFMMMWFGAVAQDGSFTRLSAKYAKLQTAYSFSPSTPIRFLNGQNMYGSFSSSCGGSKIINDSIGANLTGIYRPISGIFGTATSNTWYNGHLKIGALEWIGFMYQNRRTGYVNQKEVRVDTSQIYMTNIFQIGTSSRINDISIKNTGTFFRTKSISTFLIDTTYSWRLGYPSLGSIEYLASAGTIALRCEDATESQSFSLYGGTIAVYSQNIATSTIGSFRLNPANFEITFEDASLVTKEAMTVRPTYFWAGVLDSMTIGKTKICGYSFYADQGTFSIGMQHGFSFGTNYYSYTNDYNLGILGHVVQIEVQDTATLISEYGKVLTESQGVTISAYNGNTSENNSIVVRKDVSQFGEPTIGNYASIDSNGLRLHGSYTVYEDLRIDALSTPTGPDEPALTTGFAGSALLWQRMFQGSVRDDKIYFNIQLPHAWKEGGEFELHIHTAPWTSPAANDTAVWQLNYSWQNIDGTFAAPTTVVVKQPLGGSAQWQHKLVELVEFNSGGKTLSSVLACSIFRLANSSASDNYTGGMTILYIDCHYEVDGLGSSEELIK